MRFHSDKTAEGTGSGDTRSRSSCRSKSARIYIAGRGRTHGARKTRLIFRPLRGIIQAPPKGRPRQSRTAARGFCGENIGGVWKLGRCFLLRFLLLLVQPVKFAAEFVKVFADTGKALDFEKPEPEPLGLLGLLDKQLCGAGRGHILPPSGTPPGGGGSLGRGRLALACLTV